MLLEALAPLHVRKAQGWDKADAETIKAARLKALQSPIYHKLTALKGWKDVTSDRQAKNGTINFKVNGVIDVQCTSALAVRYQGPTDHNSIRMKVPNEIEGLPLEDAYVAMLQLIYDKFKGYSQELDISSAPGFRDSKDLSLKYRGISTLHGLDGKIYDRVDLTGNALKSLACKEAKIQYLIAIANPLTTLKGMPWCKNLNITMLPTTLDFEEEAKYIPQSVEQIVISTSSSKNIGALFQLKSLRVIGLGISNVSDGHVGVIKKMIKDIMDSPHRAKGMLVLQQYVIDNDLDDIISI